MTEEDKYKDLIQKKHEQYKKPLSDVLEFCNQNIVNWLKSTEKEDLKFEYCELSNLKHINKNKLMHRLHKEWPSLEFSIDMNYTGYTSLMFSCHLPP